MKFIKWVRPQYLLIKGEVPNHPPLHRGHVPLQVATLGFEATAPLYTRWAARYADQCTRRCYAPCRGLQRCFVQCFASVSQCRGSGRTPRPCGARQVVPPPPARPCRACCPPPRCAALCYAAFILPNITALLSRESVALVRGQCGVPQWPGTTKLSRGFGDHRGHVPPPFAHRAGAKYRQHCTR